MHYSVEAVSFTMLTRICLLLLAAAAFLPAQIIWSTDMAGSYKKALAENKPMVVLFTRADGENCIKLANGPLASREINSFASRALWVRADSANPDQHASKMMKELAIDRVPYLAVLDVGTEKIIERGAVKGYFDTQRYYFELSQIFLKPAEKVSSRDLQIPSTLAPATKAAKILISPASASDKPKP